MPAQRTSAQGNHGTFDTLVQMIDAIPVVDAHTHVQDDLLHFDKAMAGRNVAGTQAWFNSPSASVLEAAIDRGRLARRTMMDATHGLFYSWFAEIVEGANNRLDSAIEMIGSNSRKERLEAGRFILRELRDSRYCEYAEWLRTMFRLYDGVAETADPLDPDNFDRVYEAVEAQRHDPEFAARVLRAHNITSYVTSIENRDAVPTNPPVHPKDVDLSYATHSEAWLMFDFNGLLWPERATDFGLFTQGHKFEGEKYVLHLEEYLEESIGTVAQLKGAVHRFFHGIIRSPHTTPASRILYVDGFQAESFRFSRPWSPSRVDYALRHHRDQLEGDLRQEVVACVAEAMLEALDDIGREYRDEGSSHGVCVQLCGGATHFMDWAREIQSITAPIPRLAQDEYPVWIRFPHVHFEYISAHEGLYRDMANAAKQVGNVSAGPWWHAFRRHVVARMVRDQLSMGPISSIACGFTDARFVEMLVAKYRSLRLAVAEALTDLVDDPYSTLYRDVDGASEVAREILFKNPVAVHHIPVEDRGRHN